MTDFIFLGFKITADGDCRHKIKRHLLLGRKTMTNLNSILKSGDITLPTKACIVKSYDFSAVMYGCESWTIKTELQRISACKLWCWRTLESSLACRKIKHSFIKHQIFPEYSLEGLMHFCVWRCIPDVSMERGVFHVHLFLHHLILTIFIFLIIEFYGPFHWGRRIICITVGHSESQPCCQSLRSMQWICRMYYLDIVNVVCDVNFL